jgi:cellulose synthase/poly-beta-1,6-N-acetylglucosamine synthase-like glycosyltransferase
MRDWLLGLGWVYLSVFVGFHLILMGGLCGEYLRGKRRNALSASISDKELPLVSIIIPAKNEQERIGALLDSLRQQCCEKMEIIFVDDRSSDATPALLREFQETYTQHPVHIVRLEENPGPNYKQFALGAGIEHAAGDYILFTDADCSFGPDWVRSMASLLADDRVGLVIGPVFKVLENSGFFQHFQALDHAVRYMYLAASTGLGLAGGGFGNNLIFRRATIDDFGGYRKVPYSVTEDAALISMVRTHKQWKIGAALGRATRVMTLPVRSFSELLRQGLRWNNGGIFASDPLTKIGYTALMLAISLGIVSVLAVPFLPALFLFPLSVFLTMICNAIATFSVAGDSLPGTPLRYGLQAVLIPPFFTLLTILGFIRVKVTWKDDALTY